MHGEHMFRWFKKRKRITDPWDISITTLNCIDPYVLDNVYDSMYSIEFIHVVYPNILKYTLALKTINASFDKGYLLPNFEYALNASNQSVSDFFMDDRGNYLDAPKSFLEWSNEVLTYIHHIRSDSICNVHQRNVQITSHVSNNIIQLIPSLDRLLCSVNNL